TRSHRFGRSRAPTRSARSSLPPALNAPGAWTHRSRSVDRPPDWSDDARSPKLAACPSARSPPGGEFGPVSRSERARRPLWAASLLSAPQTHGLEVVRRHVFDDVASEVLRLHVGGAVVEACPDAGLGDLLERLRDAGEGACTGIARKKEGRCARDLVAPVDHVAEEHPQHANVCTVEAEMSRPGICGGSGLRLETPLAQRHAVPVAAGRIRVRRVFGGLHRIYERAA